MGKDLKGHELGKGLFQRKDGYYIARFTTKTGKRKEKYFSKIQEAKIWLRDAVYDDAHSEVIDNLVTVDTWFNFWMRESMMPRIKYNTAESYKGRYNNRIKPIIGDMRLLDVKPIDCQRVLNYCMNNNDASGTMAKIKAIMSNMFQFAIENNLMRSNPVTKAVSYVKKEKTERRAFTVEEERQFKKLAESSSYKNEFLLMLGTGMRVGEVAALKWQNVDLEKGVIHITETAFLNYETGQVEENTPKTHTSRRNIRLTKDIYDVILEQQRLTDKKNNKKHYVFLNSYGTPIKEYDVNKALHRITRDKMGIDHFSPHCLRHTFATRCVEKGMQPKALQVILGHKSITTTMDLYVHVSEKELEKEMSKMGELVGSKKQKGV